MDRPKLKIELDASDWTIEIIGASFLIPLIGYPIYYFNELPDIIPRHLTLLEY
ncbi:MAG: hypothetical protein RIC03_16080 [Cyclobacteriaceae bacterium]